MRAALLSLALLAACASAPDNPPAPSEPPAADTCGMANFRQFIGQPASVIDRSTLPPRTRIIGPNDAVTMDYSEGRLNIMTNAAGVVTELRCF